MPEIQRLDARTPAAGEAVVALLDDFGRARGFVWRKDALALALRDDGGRLAGGLLGELHWGWLRIKILAVAEGLRGQGWGRRLVEEAERLAAAAGCRHAWVDTFSFQARPFYEKLGYRVFGELPDYPPGEVRFFLTKALAGEGGEGP
jgi:GNAT superfamily N-acetyltransferase